MPMSEPLPHAPGFRPPARRAATFPLRPAR
ncbi:hypothetical protein EDC50_2918 [Vulcaniibacterium tengchongense]|uniref:Uncharacterized protein n=1 Tax=Vulcaniibacterium tengchongense TaxID=1273429 RepID=A0A3N4UZW9_9GAMM|nr:hypothetical protein EDC50_2918 [Vulcaniibacterium tengchongense]